LVNIIVWMVAFLMPVLLDRNDTVNWERIVLEWVRLTPFLFIFLAHNYILFPLFFRRKKKWLYLLLTVSTIFIVSFIQSKYGHIVHDFVGNRQLSGFQQFPENNPELLPPMTGLNIRKIRPPKDLIILDNLIICTLVVGFNLAIKLAVTRQYDDQQLQNLKKEKLETELAFLKNQLSPHFFMNTLNNIHALIDINSDDAKVAVIKLSRLMRYLLYESDGDRIQLSKEIEFINSYIDLMKLRFTEQVKVDLSFPANIPKVQIPPMLFTSLLENAFKHGVSYQTDSFVKLQINADNEYLNFTISNSKHPVDSKLKTTGGIGLENLKKRLDLIYQNRYSLQKTENENLFEISIKLPLYG